MAPSSLYKEKPVLYRHTGNSDGLRWAAVEAVPRRRPYTDISCGNSRMTKGRLPILVMPESPKGLSGHRDDGAFAFYRGDEGAWEFRGDVS